MALIVTLIIVIILTSLATGLFFLAIKKSYRRSLGIPLAVMALLLPFLTNAIPSLLVAHLIALVALPLAARRFSLLAPLYVVAILLTVEFPNTLFISSLKLIGYNLHYSISIGALAVLYRNRSRWGRVPFKLDVAFWVIWSVLCFTDFRGTSASNTIRLVADHLIHFGIPYFVMSRAVRNMDDVRAVMFALAYSGCILSFIAVFERALAWPLYRIFAAHHGLSFDGLTVKLRGGSMRPGGPFLEPTSFAGMMAFCLLAGWCMRDRFRSGAWRWLVLGAIFVGVMMPQGRNALLSLVLGLIGASLYRRRAERLALAMFGGAAVLALAFLSSPNSAISSLVAEGEGGGTVEYRQRLFSRGIEELRKTPLGDTRDAILARLRDLVQGEGIVDFVNTYLYVGLHAGIIGLALWILALMVWPFALAKTRGRASTKADVAALSFVFAVQCMPIVRYLYSSFGGRSTVMFFAFMGLAVSAFRYFHAKPRRRRDELSPLAPRSLLDERPA